MQNRFQYLAVAAFASLLVGCGGGSSGSGVAPVEAQNAAPSTTIPVSPVTPAVPVVPAGTTDVATAKSNAAPLPAASPSPPRDEVDTTALSIAQNIPVGPNGNKSSVGNFSAPQLERTLADGVKIWREQRIDINGVNKGACANCHSADGIEVAMWDFHDDDIRRRGHIDGTSAADREKLVDYIAALRQKYKIVALKSIKYDRPFQPKGQPFDGNTTAERDLAFANYSLKDVAPTLYNHDIDSVAKAKQARDELAASNPLNMKIGIPFPRISEDCFRGNNIKGSSHCSANDWMADVPRIPKPDKADEWFKINDEYIASPTDVNLRRVLIATDTLTDPWINPGQASPGAAANIGLRKFKSMQILQHRLRRQQLGLLNPLTDQNPLDAVAGHGQKRPNAPFLVGDSTFGKDDPVWKTGSDMPVFVRRSLGELASGPALTDDDVQNLRDQMFTPWWYVGFMFDPGLGTGTGSEYFLGSLGSDARAGYPFHRYYAIGKHGAIVINAQRTPNLSASDVAAANVAFDKAAWKDVGSDDLPRIFASAEARQQYRRLEMSWTLMWMYLVKEQLQKSGKASFDAHFDIDLNICANPDDRSKPEQYANSLRRWVGVVAGFDGARAQQAFNLFNDINTLAGCGLPSFPATYIAGTGTGLSITWYQGAGDEFNGKSAWLTGSPKLASRIEPIVYFPGSENGLGYFAVWAKTIGVDLAAGSSAPASSRGSGSILAPVTGQYEFLLGGGFGRIKVNNVEVFSEFRFNEGNPLRVKIALQAGQKVPFEYERHGYAPGGTQLTWEVAGQFPRSTVPTSQVFPN